MKGLLTVFLYIIGVSHFIFCFIVIFISLFLFNRDRVLCIIQFLFRIMLFLLGIRLTVTGHENFDSSRSYIIMGNHESLFDAFAVPVAIPMRFVAVEALGHFSIPLWGFLVKKWGNIPIDRKNLEEAIKSIEKARDILASGTSLIIMPEGGRSVTGELKEFKKGPFHLALASGVDILPFAMTGMYRYKNKNSWILNPGKAYINFGKPIPYNSFKNRSVEELRDIVKENILSLKKNNSLTDI